MRLLAALGFLTSAILSLLPLGCASNTKVVPIRQAADDDTHAIPAMTVERLQECATVYADQLDVDGSEFRYQININENGQKVNVTSAGIPAIAGNFAACTRIVLQDMAIPNWVLNMRRSPQLGISTGNTLPTPALLGSATAVETVVDFGRLVVRAGGTTILLTITIGLAISGAMDIAEALDELERCKKVKERCLARSSVPAGLLGPRGGKFRRCMRECMESQGCLF